MTKNEDSMDPAWKDLYQEIGILVVAAGQLEETVRCVLLNLLGDPHWRKSGLVVHGFSARQMVDSCERLAGIVLGGSLQTDTLHWLSEVRGIQDFRNGLVHSDWASKVSVQNGNSVGPAAITRKKLKGSEIQRKVYVYTPQEIRVAAGKCAQASIVGSELTSELQEFAELERQKPGHDITPWTRS